MKRIVAALLCLGISLGVCVAEYVFVKNSTDEFISRIEHIEKALYNQNAEEAYKYAQEIDSQWKDTMRITDMLLYHDYVYEVGTELATLKVYIAEEETAEVYAACERAKRQLMTLMDNEKPTAENII